MIGQDKKRGLEQTLAQNLLFSGGSSAPLPAAKLPATIQTPFLKPGITVAKKSASASNGKGAVGDDDVVDNHSSRVFQSLPVSSTLHTPEWYLLLRAMREQKGRMVRNRDLFFGGGDAHGVGSILGAFHLLRVCTEDTICKPIRGMGGRQHFRVSYHLPT